MIFRQRAALNLHLAHARDAGKQWGERVLRQGAQFGLALAVGCQAVGDHRKAGWVFPMHAKGRARRQAGQHRIHRGGGLQLGAGHVGAPGKTQIQIGTAPIGAAGDRLHARHRAQGLFNRLGDAANHLRGIAITRIDSDHNPREAQAREQRHR